MGYSKSIMSMLNIIKLSLILGSIITLIHQLPALYEQAPVNWLALLLSYTVSFFSFYLSAKFNKPSRKTDSVETSQSSLNPQHLEALYKQASLVERNAHKANKVFTHQLQYIKKMLNNTKQLERGEDFEMAHSNLIKELALLEQHVGRIVTEMNKNVRLGEKLQQSIDNIDPEIGVI